MSLLSHLKDPHSPIGQFFRQRFSQTTSITQEANRRLRNTNIILPSVPISPYIAATLGTAIDYRIRYSFAIMPSHRLIAWEGAWALMSLSDRWKLSEKVIETFFEKGGQGGGVRIPNYDETENEEGASLPHYSFEVMDGFFESLNTVLTTIQPVRRRLNLEEERILARYCFVLSLFEQVSRSGRSEQGFLMEPAPKESVDELLAISESAWIDDLSAMSTLFYDKCHHLLSLPFRPNPLFMGSNDVGGADADFIVDGCLIDIKAVKEQSLKALWLRQIIGYVLLDYNEAYNIHSVGIYMARQGELLQWPVADFLRLLMGNDVVSLAQLRQEFRTVCQHTQ